MKRNETKPYGNIRSTTAPHARISTAPAVQYQIAGNANNQSIQFAYSAAPQISSSTINRGNLNSTNQTTSQQVHLLTAGLAANATPRHNNTNNSGPVNVSTTSVPAQPPASTSSGQQAQFQRLKVEDALSYLDQVNLEE